MPGSSKRNSAAQPEQVSFLPSPLEDAILNEAARAKAEAASAQSLVLNDRQKKMLAITTKTNSRFSISVIGEKQFKNPLLFPPPSTKGLDKPRVVVFGTTVEEGGSKVESSVRILGNNVTGCYTSDTLEVIGAINEMWREQGQSQKGVVVGTYADLARRVNRGDENNANRHRKHVARELDRLKFVNLVFSVYHTSERVIDNQAITYLTEYRYVTDETNPSNNYFFVQINPAVLDNLRTGYISSLPLASLLELKIDNAKPILLKVDSILAGVEKCELSCDSVYELICVPKTAWYAKPWIQQKILTQIATDLNGKILSSGWTVLVTMATMANNKDVKLVFHRGEHHQRSPISTQQNQQGRSISVVNTDPTLVQMLVNDMILILGGTVQNKSLYTLYARSYPEELVHRAISEFKADKPANLQSPGAFFSSVLSRIVKENGYAWIKSQA